MRFLANLTLGKKIILLTILGLVLEVGILGFLGLRAVDQSTEAMLEDRMTTARLVADYLDESLSGALAEVEILAFAAARMDDLEGMESQVDHLEDIFRHLALDIYGIYLLDRSENVIWSSVARQPGTGVITPPLAFNGILEETGSSISGLVSAPVTDIPVVLLSCAFSGSSGGRDGVLVVAIDLTLSGITGFVRPIRMGETGYVEIVDYNGIVLARTQPGPEVAPFERSDHKDRFATLIAVGEPTRGLCHTCHDPVLRVQARDVLAFIPMESARWGVVIRQSEEEALGPINELRWNLLFFAVGLSAIILLVVSFTTRNVVGRIRMLNSASQRIAAGDLNSPIIVTQRDEVSVLANTFEDMRVKLHESYSQLEGRTRDLASLLSISEVLSHLSDLSDLETALGLALDKTLAMTEIDSGTVLLLDEGKKQLVARVRRGKFTDWEATASQLNEDDVIATVRGGEPVIVPDMSRVASLSASVFGGISGLRGFLAIPLTIKKSFVGVLIVGSKKKRDFSAVERQLLDGVARQLAGAVENASLHSEVRNKEKIRGELLEDIFAIQEEERRRIARELHDETSQVIASMRANIEAGIGTLPENSERSLELLLKARSLSSSILDEIHNLIYELRPTLLDDMGLEAALGWLMDNHLKTLDMACEFKTTGRAHRLKPHQETTIFRAVQEAVKNIARHAEAKSARITLSFLKKDVSVRIWDDGKGFDVDAALRSKERPRGLGLLGTIERIELMHGTYSIKSKVGAGTEIRFKIPLTEEVRDD